MKKKKKKTRNLAQKKTLKRFPMDTHFLECNTIIIIRNRALQDTTGFWSVSSASSLLVVVGFVQMFAFPPI